MHTNFDNNTDKYHPAFSHFAFDLLEDILESTHQPAKMNRLLAEQLRLITGAQLVVLVRQRVVHDFADAKVLLGVGGVGFVRERVNQVIVGVQ